MSPRPKWIHETPEDVARWLLNHHVTKITHHWEFTSADTARDWITLHSSDGKRQREFPSAFFRNNQEFEFAPDHAGLIRPRPYSRVGDSIRAIDQWEKANAHDRSEYERLKQKFG
jgi:hypothetical protein